MTLVQSIIKDPLRSLNIARHFCDHPWFEEHTCDGCGNTRQYHMRCTELGGDVIITEDEQTIGAHIVCGSCGREATKSFYYELSKDEFISLFLEGLEIA